MIIIHPVRVITRFMEPVFLTFFPVNKEDVSTRDGSVNLIHSPRCDCTFSPVFSDVQTNCGEILFIFIVTMIYSVRFLVKGIPEGEKGATPSCRLSE